MPLFPRIKKLWQFQSTTITTLTFLTFVPAKLQSWSIISIIRVVLIGLIDHTVVTQNTLETSKPYVRDKICKIKICKLVT